MSKYAEMGLLGMCLGSEWGGSDQPALNAILAVEELAKFSPIIAGPVFESNVGPVRVVEQLGTDEQCRSVIPFVCSGEYSVSISMTEPNAGSDLTALTTRAVDLGDHYLLNGNKIFITGGGHASHYLVYARVGDTPGYKGIGAILVEKGSPGFTFGKQEDFLGLRGMPSCELIFEDVKVPKENLVVKAGDFNKLMSAFALERCGNAAMCLGVAGGALEEARRYASERKAFGRPICEFQAIQFMIVDMAMQLDAARLLVYRAACEAGNGLPGVYQAAMAKCYANEMVIDVTNKAMQVLVVTATVKYPVERCFVTGEPGSRRRHSANVAVTMASYLFGRRFDQRK